MGKVYHGEETRGPAAAALGHQQQHAFQATDKRIYTSLFAASKKTNDKSINKQTLTKQTSIYTS